MLPGDERWDEFCDRLEGPEGCDFQLDEIAGELVALTDWIGSPEAMGLDAASFERLTTVVNAAAGLPMSQLIGQSRIAKWQIGDIMYLSSIVLSVTVATYRELTEKGA